MKQKLIFSFLPAMLLLLLTGCLKDKDFDEQKYGLQNPDGKSIGFIQSFRSPFIVGITGQSGPLTVDGPLITINGTNKQAAATVNIKIVEDASLVTAAGLTPLPAGTYNVNTLTPSIEAGEAVTSELEISVSGSDQLDPNLIYGIGYRIESVDGGYDIGGNMKTVVIGFAIKNKYDGIYRLQGYHNRPTLDYPYDTEVHLITVGPNSVIFYWPEAGENGHPIGAGPNNNLSWYGTGIQPVVVFDLTTNLVTDVYNDGGPTPITLFTGAGSRISRFDPVTRAMTVDWNYSNNPMRAFFDDLTFISERP